MSETIAVVGAGLSGLSCALHLLRAGRAVTVYEASGQPGGRCRSFFDPVLNRTIDNGTHLMLAGNRTLESYVRALDAEAHFLSLPPSFSVLDLKKERLTTTALKPGRFPLRLLWDSVRLFTGTASDTVSERLKTSPLFSSFWRPLSESVLNTAPGEASAALLGRVLRLIFAGGPSAARPRLAIDGLSAALIEPAVRMLQANGVELHLFHRLRRLNEETLVFEAFEQPHAAVVLALPPYETRRLLPDLPVFPTRCILNAHFLLTRPLRFPKEVPFLGLVGGTGHWLFIRDDVLSVTVSAADDLARLPNDAVAALLWDDIGRVFGLSGSPPPCRIVRERRATIAQDPATLSLRPPPGFYRPGVYLAGDWTDTGLPCTIEGALLSGKQAAASLLERLQTDR